MATHSSILPWRIPWTEEPGRQQSQKVRHNWATNTTITVLSFSVFDSRNTHSIVATTAIMEIFTYGELKTSVLSLTSASAAAAKLLQSCLTLCNLIDGSPPGSPVPGVSRQEHCSGLPFPSPMHKSESEVAQSCPTLSDPMDCSLPGSSIHGIFQARYWSGVPLPSPIFDI